MQLVDLAGSESARLANYRASSVSGEGGVTGGGGGVRLKEGAYINKSLLALGTVVRKLSDAAKSAESHGRGPSGTQKETREEEERKGLAALQANMPTLLVCLFVCFLVS